MAFEDYLRRKPIMRLCPACGQEVTETEPNSGSYSCSNCGEDFDSDGVNADGTYHGSDDGWDPVP